jgi:AraC-like DNA-binding protein
LVPRALLIDTSLTIDSVGVALGYSEVAAFSRAFSRWSGMSASDWRAAHRDRSAPAYSHAVGKHQPPARPLLADFATRQAPNRR